MRIYNRKKRAISLVMAIMVMSNSIQITGLAEGEKEEGKKIIISEFQELPEELSSMKVPEGTSQEEFEKLFPDTLMVKTYRDDAEEQKPEQPTSAVTPAVPDGVQKPSEGEMPEENLNPSEGEKPGEPQNPSEGETPGENQAKTRPVFDGYKAARYSKKYLAQHEAELADYRAAKAAINELLDGAKLPKMDTLKKKRRELADKKKSLYAEYRNAQADMREAVAVKANVDHLLGYPDGREDKAQER